MHVHELIQISNSFPTLFHQRELEREDVLDMNDTMEIQDQAPMFDQSETAPHQTAPQEPPGAHASSQHHQTIIEEFPGAAQTFGIGPTFLDKFNMDQYAAERTTNLYYPFASKEEWEFALFLLRSKLSMVAINAMLTLQLIRRAGPSFRTARDLRNRAEILPGCPQWKCKAMRTVHPTKYPIHLFYRNPIECLQVLLENPKLKSHIQFTPLRIFQLAQERMRVYSEWWTGDAAWSMQEKIPAGATLLGTILSSDKTNISIMTGGRAAHPLLISLANISMDVRTRSSNHAFLLLALLPIPKFTHKNKKICGVLESRLVHECLDIITQPLKKAAEIGVMMTDPLGYRRYCFTPLAAYIVDTPEATMLAGVAGKTSPVTLASYTQFGDNFRHHPRMAQNTLRDLQRIESESQIHPWDLKTYIKEAMKYRLNGVHQPFFRDWPMSEPSIFLTPELLHHSHKFSWDHDVTWCRNILGSAEIDFRFSVLQPHTGFRHFTEGISNLQQVTGRKHRDVERYLIPVIADGVPTRFLIALRALMDFRYLEQARVIDERACTLLQASLKEFHDNKASILAADARQGKQRRPINNWHIPKLEFFQSVVPGVRLNGPPIQWSADTTEHAHITEIKDPARASNNRQYEEQICRYLDRTEKCRQFDMATSMLEKMDHPSDTLAAPESDNIDTQAQAKTDYFDLSDRLKRGEFPSAPTPLRTFSNECVALHMAYTPHLGRMSIDEVATKFQIPDLNAVLSMYAQQKLSRESAGNNTLCIPFHELEVWTNTLEEADGGY
ncbi:hypothetical protein BD779DRAFT_1675909 [Infundibulicybe gibba]|nr:hypothetical protein BD779DRAFT_1675909 [Infundibulicybe gibba]